MDTQTRRANFKKIQTANQAKRTTRSAKAATTPMTLSEYFSSTECPSSAETSEQQEQDQLFAEPKTKKSRESRDVQPAVAAAAKPKKAPKLKATASSKRARGVTGGRSKKQPIISDFLRNEQLFAEVTAQHCMADNFSPDDIEMALALSKSEAEKLGRLRLEDTEDERENVVNLLDDDANQSKDNIRRQLQKYGFRTAAKEEYNVLSIANLPGVAGKRNKRCKWANKFTALTLRNPSEQLKKLKVKIDALMAQQVRTKLPSGDHQPPFQLISPRLLQLEAPAGQRIHHEPNAESLTNLSAYYVPELIEVSRTPANHLLKSWEAIPGRDLSPKRMSDTARHRQQQLERVYRELEAYFGAAAEEKELDELEKLVADNMIHDSSQAESVAIQLPADAHSMQAKSPKASELEKVVADNMMQHANTELMADNEPEEVALPADAHTVQAKSPLLSGEVKILLNESPLKEPPDKRPKMIAMPSEKGQDLSSDKENLQPSSSSMLSIPTQSTRCTSPDLFADSDDESDKEETASAGAAVEMKNFSLKVYQDISTTAMNCYEIYSSDEVKTVYDAEADLITLQGEDRPRSLQETTALKEEDVSQCQDNFIDLTQGSDTPDVVDIMDITSSKSLLEQQIFPLSPTIDFDEDNELEEDSEHKHHSSVSETHIAAQLQTEVLDRHSLKLNPSNSDKSIDIAVNHSFNLSSKSSLKSDSVQLNIMDNHSFSLSLNSSDPKCTADSVLSFSQLENTKMAFQRSFNLSQSDGQKPENSFKSPLSTRSNSFTCRANSPATTPLSDSAASIDLTQDSGDDDEDDTENGGALLSDDEINYSIWKADKPNREAHEEQSSENETSYSSSLAKIKSMPFFRTEDELDAYLDACSMPAGSNSRSPNKSSLSKERAEFGILDAANSEPFTLSQLQSDSSQVNIDWAEASFLDTPPEAPIKRYSGNCTHKFKTLLSDLIDKPADPTDFDEFDRLVFETEKETTSAVDAVPSGLDRLLTGDINVEPEATPTAQPDNVAGAAGFEQVEVQGLVYNVRVCHSPKPDFMNMSEAELLQQLYKYGIKPLKRKQAVKLLEYIYNQTHPIMLPMEQEPAREQAPLPLPRSKSTPLTAGAGKASKSRLLQAASSECLTPSETDPQPVFSFNDASGSELLRFSEAVPPALCDDFEYYVLQTNVTKKTPQPLVPLHIAWHNLLCANPSLHESVLMYEPIDLQQIYLYFKQLGHRYEPKDLKCFFDKRCIIFRYELAPVSSKSAQPRHHVRKPKTKKKASGKSN